MGFHEGTPPPYSGTTCGPIIWNMMNAPESERRQMLAKLSGDDSWTKGPKKLEVLVHDSCEYCGKSRNVSLIPMQHGWAWYCFWCQMRYLWRSRSHRKDIYARVAQAKEQPRARKDAL